MERNPACIQEHNCLKRTKQMHQANFLSLPKVFHWVHRYYLWAQLIIRQNVNHQPFLLQCLQAEGLKKAMILPKSDHREIFLYHHKISYIDNNVMKFFHFIIFLYLVLIFHLKSISWNNSFIKDFLFYFIFTKFGSELQKQQLIIKANI